MNPELKQQLWSIFKSFGDTAASMNHWELEEACAGEGAELNADLWKAFLNEPDVIDWVNNELNIVQRTELGKMLKDVSSTKSIGQAQMLNTLSKMDNSRTKQEGPTFIYTYVPLNPEQAQAENVVKLTTDIFLKEQEDDLNDDSNGND